VEVAGQAVKLRNWKSDYPGWPVMESDFSIADSPFQMICVPMQTSRNEESRMMTAMEVAPNISANRSANA
jgi:hypothetical protein